MANKEIFDKIVGKKEFSQLPKEDIERAFKCFEKRQCSDEEKIRLTRDLLRKVFSVFTSRKLLIPKVKGEEFVLKKHKSTEERINYYNEVYSRLLGDIKSKKLSIIDLGAGVNGFSYNYFKKLGYNVDYLAIESMGQLVDLMNLYFKEEKMNARALHLSLFDLDKVKEEIKNMDKPRVIFLMKAIDSLEMLEPNYSKKLIKEISPLADKIVLSFPTRSLNKRTKFKAGRYWILTFLEENYKILDDFELGGERYVVFE